VISVWNNTTAYVNNKVYCSKEIILKDFIGLNQSDLMDIVSAVRCVLNIVSVDFYFPFILVLIINNEN